MKSVKKRTGRDFVSQLWPAALLKQLVAMFSKNLFWGSHVTSTEELSFYSFNARCSSILVKLLVGFFGAAVKHSLSNCSVFLKTVHCGKIEAVPYLKQCFCFMFYSSMCPGLCFQLVQ